MCLGRYLVLRHVILLGGNAARSKVEEPTLPPCLLPFIVGRRRRRRFVLLSRLLLLQTFKLTSA